MRISNKKLTVKSILVLTIISLCLIPTEGISDDSALKGSMPMISCVEGNVIYYAKTGDKVEKGEPLFFVKSNDFPLGKIKQCKQDVAYFNKTYIRKKKLAKTHSISVQEMDDAWRDYHDAINDLAIAEQQSKNGFYTAPYDCEIIRCEVPESSGRGDGDPVMYIKKIATSDKK